MSEYYISGSVTYYSNGSVRILKQGLCSDITAKVLSVYCCISGSVRYYRNCRVKILLQW